MPSKKTKDITVHVDGGCRSNGSPDGEMYCSVAVDGRRVLERKELGTGTNNRAEYMALLEAARYLTQAGVPVRVQFRSDSALMVNQMLHRWSINDATLQQLCERAWKELRGSPAIKEWTLVQVGRKEIVSVLGH